jgi:LCP family protein required for cell wall assembly
MMVLSINKETKKMVLTSFMRDMYVEIPGKGNNRLNAAYAYGGADLLIKTLESNFGMKIDRYAHVDFYAFINVIDTLGGVEIEHKLGLLGVSDADCLLHAIAESTDGKTQIDLQEHKYREDSVAPQEDNWYELMSTGSDLSTSTCKTVYEGGAVKYPNFKTGWIRI